jgi:epoxyqueuosine reductase
MEKKENTGIQTRRQFVKSLAAAGSLLCLGAGKNVSFAQSKKVPPPPPTPFEYKYRTISVERVHEIKDWFDKLRHDQKLSTNETFQKYIGGFNFEPEKSLPNAKSIIILSIPLKIASVTFGRNGRLYDVLIPTGYADDGLTFEGVEARIRKDIVKDPARKLQPRVRLPLKSLAVRSGLAKYGRNNITYVDDFGSFHELIAFYADQVLEDNWGPLRLLEYCKGCSICIKNCPTKIIGKENFVIDAGQCITLYSELPAPMPAWIDPKAHNALVGCLKCQYDCPANSEGIHTVDKLADITEEETELILNQGTDKKLQQSIFTKLAKFPLAQDFAYFSRNLKLVMANTIPR